MSNLISCLLFPPTCKGCGARFALTPDKAPLPVFCTSCESAWQSAMRAECPRCFRPRFSCACMTSSMKKVGFCAHVKLAKYSDSTDDRVMRHALLYMKDHACAPLFERCADELKSGVLETLNDMGYDAEHALIVPVPRHEKNARRAGMDQAVMLANALSRATGIEMVPLLKRAPRASVQKSLDETARFENSKGVFVSKDVPYGRCVLLVDDVVTTGATMCAAGAALRAAHATDVVSVSLAATEKKRNSA